ncbi:MAG: UDP-N-acetylmuramoyl-tripeptide--D-alanyl-D-alanine ligase [Lachnospiraceae bacterium]|nr:UDP-N-acetylmuramoyl-tripeptide--D-alanyl-D-alanine ligase [Lachnospiraceae bacterium]
MTARTVITVIFSIYTMYLVLRHNMHMFQLNGYKNDEHIRWIRKNLRQQWLLFFGLFLGIIRIFIPALPLDIIIWLTLIMDILVYRAIRRLNNKKKLVYTPRVKRMIFTIVILTVLIAGGAVYKTGIRPAAGLCMVLIFMQLFMNIVSNIINHPVEAAISGYYINDAKRMLREKPDMKIIGVTGSYGKTSVKYYLKTLLQSRFDVLVTPGNFNTPLGVTRTIRENLKPSHEIFICEMGARRVGEIKELCDLVHPDHGIITAVGPQHLETFFSIENIKKTKFELADAVSDKGMIFLNGDNEYIREMSSDYPSGIMYYSDDQAGNGYHARDIRVSNLGTEFTVVTPEGETGEFRMRLIGAHNIINVVGAIAVANKLGIPLKDLRIPVRRIEPVEHRMQIKDQGQVTMIDDAYNSNPVGSKAAVETLSMFEGLRILITPGMVELGDKEEEYNRKFGTYAAKNCDYILLVGKKRTEPIKEGAESAGFDMKRLRSFDKLEEAYSYACSIKDEGHKYILLENDLPDNY